MERFSPLSGKIRALHRLPVTYRPAAQDDLDAIFRYILLATQSFGIAEGFVRRIKARCDRIGNIPLGGRNRDDLEPGLLTVSFERCAVIAYKVEAERVRITNVFYGGRDFEALYRGQENAGE